MHPAFLYDNRIDYSNAIGYLQLVDCIDDLEDQIEEILNVYEVACNKKRKRELSEDDEYHNKQLIDNSNAVSIKTKSAYKVENLYRGLKDLSNPLDALTDMEILKEYKISRKSIYDILELIKHNLQKLNFRGSPISPLMCLLITLKYLTSGSTQKESMPEVSQSTVSRIVNNTTLALLKHQHTYIKFPTAEDVEQVKSEFYQRGKFPETIGCVGCSHVGIRVKAYKKDLPSSYYSNYRNEKGYHSLRVQLIVGPHGEIYDIDPKFPSSFHENAVFNLSDVNKNMIASTLNGVFIGGEAYNPTPHIMTSIKNTQQMGEYLYNEALNETYTVFNNTIDNFKRRFKCLQKFLNCKISTQQNVIICCAIIHNIAKINNDFLLAVDEQSDIVDPCPPRASKRIQRPLVEESALQGRKHFIQKHFQYTNNSSYFYM